MKSASNSALTRLQSCHRRSSSCRSLDGLHLSWMLWTFLPSFLPLSFLPQPPFPAQPFRLVFPTHCVPSGFVWGSLAGNQWNYQVNHINSPVLVHSVPAKAVSNFCFHDGAPSDALIELICAKKQKQKQNLPAGEIGQQRCKSLLKLEEAKPSIFSSVCANLFRILYANIL